MTDDNTIDEERSQDCKNSGELPCYTRCKVKALNVSSDMVLVDYSVSHNNGTTTVEQSMRLVKERGKWKAEIQLFDFPEQDTPDRAATKLSEWLGRLSLAIAGGECSNIYLDDLGV